MAGGTSCPESDEEQDIHGIELQLEFISTRSLCGFIAMVDNTRCTYIAGNHQRLSLLAFREFTCAYVHIKSGGYVKAPDACMSSEMMGYSPKLVSRRQLA